MAKYSVKYTVNPEVTCPICHRKNRLVNVDYCPDFIRHQKVHGLKPHRWVFKNR